MPRATKPCSVGPATRRSRSSDQFAKETDPAKQKQIVEDLQKYWVDHPTHINVGQWYAPIARRNNVEGNLTAPAPVFWNVSKK